MRWRSSSGVPLGAERRPSTRIRPSAACRSAAGGWRSCSCLSPSRRRAASFAALESVNETSFSTQWPLPEVSTTTRRRTLDAGQAALGAGGVLGRAGSGLCRSACGGRAGGVSSSSEDALGSTPSPLPQDAVLPRREVGDRAKKRWRHWMNATSVPSASAGPSATPAAAAPGRSATARSRPRLSEQRRRTTAR